LAAPAGVFALRSSMAACIASGVSASSTPSTSMNRNSPPDLLARSTICSATGARSVE
jgi:hypothetical protein